MSQAVLTRNPDDREIVHHDTEDRRIICPDCGGDVSATKGGHPLPEDAPAQRCHGWQCRACANTMPCTATGPEAAMYVDKIVGVEVTYRDGTTEWIAFPESATGGESA